MAIDPVTQGIRRGAALFGFLKAWRLNRRNRRKAKLEGREPEVEVPMFQGKLTYTGVVVLGLGWVFERFGVPVAPAELEGMVAAIVAAVGTAAALYGRWRATKTKPA